MKVLITGGGTGGHIYPAIAVAQALKADSQTVAYVGKRGGMEEAIAEKNGLEFAGIEFSGMPRRLSPALFGWMRQWVRATGLSGQILSAFGPDVVFATGGYVSAPVLLAARLRGIPYIVHEPDARPGLVNRLFGRFAACATGAFEAASGPLACRHFELTGNPVREGLGQLPKREALDALGLSWPDDAQVLLVLGGSQGARSLNRAVAEALPFLLEEMNLHIIHQSGDKLYPEAREAAGDLASHSRYHLRPFFADMPAVLSAGTLALCRAGSMTLSELAVSGLPAILVPYPYAAADHQRKNAEAVVRAGAARMIEDKELDGDCLIKTLQPILKNPGVLADMSNAALGLAHPEATRQLVALIKSTALRKPVNSG